MVCFQRPRIRKEIRTGSAASAIGVDLAWRTLKGTTVLKIHTNNGKTARVDLEDEGQAKEWLQRLSDPEFQAAITGMTVAQRGVQYSLPRPIGFREILYLAELVAPDQERRIKGGERITCIAGDVRATVMVHQAQRAVRVSLLRTGKQRFNPMARGSKG